MKLKIDYYVRYGADGGYIARTYRKLAYYANDSGWRYDVYGIAMDGGEIYLCAVGYQQPRGSKDISASFKKEKEVVK